MLILTAHPSLEDQRKPICHVCQAIYLKMVKFVLKTKLYNLCVAPFTCGEDKHEDYVNTKVK